MIAVSTIAVSETQQDFPVDVRRIQKALTALGQLDGIFISLSTADGRALPIFGGGSWAPAATSPSTFPTEAVRIRMENGDYCLIHDETGEGALLRSVKAVLQATLQCLDLEKREEGLLEELGANWESLEALYEISTDVLRSDNIKDGLKRLIDRLVFLQRGLHAVLFVARNGRLESMVSTDLNVEPLDLNQLGKIQKVMSDRQVVTVNRLSSHPDPHTCWRNATCLAAAPLTSRQDCVGFVAVWREDLDYEFDSPFLRLLEAITYQASMLIESERLNRRLRESELLAKEIEIASSIQQTLLLANAPQYVQGMEIASCSVPSQHIDGDFHDFFQHPNGTVDVFVGDVMGKGVAAALLGAATKNQLLRSIANLCLRSGMGVPQPVDIVKRAGSRIGKQLMSLERFVTLFYARFDSTSKTLVFVDCGHTATLLNRKGNDQCILLQGDDLPVGVFQQFDCSEHSIAFRPGDTFLFYSDGVTENRSPEGEFFGADRLAECVQNWSSLGPALLVEQIRKEAVRFNGTERFADDFTCIAVRIRICPELLSPLVKTTEIFRCDSQELSRFRGWLCQSTGAEGTTLGADDLARMELACTELFVNCVFHATHADCPRPITAESSVYDQHVTVRIRHEGPAFDPLSVPPPNFDGSKDGGFGTYIVLRSADEATYVREPDGTNIITVTFLRSVTD